MNEAGFDVEPYQMDLSSRASIIGMIERAQELGEIVMGPKGAFISGSDFLIDGGATASYYYGPLQPEEQE